jgi:hypothetical protein
LRGRQLLVARVAWVAVAVTVLAIVIFSVPSSFEHHRSVCTATSEVCSERALGQPTPDGVRALQNVGLSVRTYALLNVVVDKLGDLVWLAVGALIFLRRSDDRMALLVSLFLATFGPIMMGESNQLATVASTLAIAALFNPLRRRVQAFVDQRFYRKRYDARKTLEAFSLKLRNETDLDALSEDLVGAVSETMQPEHVSL